MKFAKYASRVIACAATIAVVVMFFLNIVTITSSYYGEFNLSGFQLAFGSSLTSNVNSNPVSFNLWKSAYYTFTFIFAAVTAVLGVCSFKSKKCSWVSMITGAVTMIMMLIFNFSTVGSYVDWRAIEGVTGLVYETPFYIALISSIAFIIIMAAAILIADKVEVMESNGAKKTIIQKIVAFFREYKSEIKKITWPVLPTVVKNTIVVLVTCVVIGAFIWLVDLGLGKLLELVFKIS